MLLNLASDSLIRLQIYPEGLLTEKVFSTSQDIDVDAFMKMMRDSTINGFDVWIRKQFPGVGGRLMDALKGVCEPVKKFWVGIAHRHDLGNGGSVGKMHPASDCTGEFTPHQTQSDDPKRNTTLHIIPSPAISP